MEGGGDWSTPRPGS